VIELVDLVENQQEDGLMTWQRSFGCTLPEDVQLALDGKIWRGMNECMNEWTNERTNKWQYDRKNEWMNECMNERMRVWQNEWQNDRMNELMTERKNKWQNEWMNDEMNEWMNEWMNECTRTGDNWQWRIQQWNF